MKVTYLERIENHIALNSKMFCSKCGAHEYDIVEQLEPEPKGLWFVRCPQCEFESPKTPNKKCAIAWWKNL